jgi:chromatin modification-related protein EAF6
MTPQASIEENIFRLESSYLEDTMPGNIVKGFDGYLKGSTGGGGGGTATRRKGGVTEVDRIFSKSSATTSRVRTWLCTKLP